jgi:hypothetical protein
MHVVGRASTLVPAAGINGRTAQPMAMHNDVFAHDVYDDNWSRSTHASFSQRPSAGDVCTEGRAAELFGEF